MSASVTRYALQVDSASQSQDPSNVRATAGRKPGFVPGQKKARHQRWTRITTVVTILGLVACVAFGVFVAPRLFDRPTLEENRIAGCRDFLMGISDQVRIFAGARERLPKTLAELRDPMLPSVYDAEPWDVWRKPIEYRVLDETKREFELRSLGPDKLPDTKDDIVWPEGAVWR